MKRVVVFAALMAALVPACDRSSHPPAGSQAAPVPSAPVGSAGSQTGSAAVTAARGSAARPAVVPLAHALLWSAEKAGVTTYLFGTMHLGIDAMSQLPPIVWTKLDEAPVFAMEANLEDPHIAQALKPVRGASLHQSLGDDYWKKLGDAIGAGVAAALDTMPAMVPATVLLMKGLPPTLPMDKALSMRATKDHKTVVYLEPAERQIALLSRWMDVKALKMILDELPETQQRAQDALAAYTAGDEHQILAVNDAEKTDALQHGYTAAEYDRETADLLYDRNASWIKPIEELHASGGGFVAVGALHLIGPRSVLALLAKNGYKITRLTP